MNFSQRAINTELRIIYGYFQFIYQYNDAIF